MWNRSNRIWAFVAYSWGLLAFACLVKRFALRMRRSRICSILFQAHQLSCALGMSADSTADFITMHFERPGRGLQPIAVLLLDIDADRLHVRSRRDCRSVAGPEDAGVLETILFDLAADARQRNGSAILAELEDVLSNSIRLTGRTRLKTNDIQGTLDALYAQHVGDGDGSAADDRNL